MLIYLWLCSLFLWYLEYDEFEIAQVVYISIAYVVPFLYAENHYIVRLQLLLKKKLKLEEYTLTQHKLTLPSDDNAECEQAQNHVEILLLVWQTFGKDTQYSVELAI